MGLDMHVRIREVTKCPYCGEDIPGDVQNEWFTGGQRYRPFLDEIGYGDEQYGKKVFLEGDEVGKLVRALKDGGEISCAGAVAQTFMTSGFIEIDADW